VEITEIMNEMNAGITETTNVSVAKTVGVTIGTAA